MAAVHGRAATIATAAGGFVLLDSLRVWLPSLTTIYGSAGSTSPITLAAFALSWVVPVVLAVPLAGWRHGRWLPLAAACMAIAARVALQSGATGTAQLYASSVAVAAGFVWLMAAAVRGWPPRAVALGLAWTLAATTLMQLATGGVDLTWLPPAVGWPLLLVAATLWLIAHRAIDGGVDHRGSGGAAVWFASMPALMLGGLVTTVIGRVWAGHAPWPPSFWGGALVGIGAALGVFAAQRDRAGSAFAGAALVVVATALADLPRDGEAFPAWIAWPQAALACALAAALAHAAHSRERSALRRGLAAYVGLLLSFVLAVLYYVAFDLLLPVPRPAFVLAIAALLALAAWAGRARPGSDDAPSSAPAASHGSRRAIATAAIAALAIGAAAWTAPAGPEPASRPAHWPLRVMSYNIRYGISEAGRFDPQAIAAAIRAQQPDVVMLQEVDRGFLLNGGHDVLALLQRELRMHVYYNPASEPLFGDAILSRWPLRDVRAAALPTYDVPTRPGVLSGVLPLAHGGELVLAVSHLHENDAGVDVRQVRDLSDRVRSLSHGRPTILGGDYNLEPDDARLQPLRWLRDGLAVARPLPTWSSSRPTQQLDYLFVSPGLRASAIRAPDTQASDHRPVVATVDASPPDAGHAGE